MNLKPTAPATIGAAIRKGVTLPLVMAATFAAAYSAASAFAPATVSQEPPQASVSAPSYVSELMDLHECWTGDQDALTDTPAHVLITEDGSNHPIHSDRVADAVDQISYDHPELGWAPGRDHGLTVHAVCV